MLEPVPLLATDPLYILYTSGTTGIPKGVVRDNGGHMVALKWSMKNLYGVEPGETVVGGSDIGWVVGHSYIVYAPLFHGATTILYEGKPVGTPDAGAFWRVIAEHGAVAMFTAPTAFRAIKKEDPEGKLFREIRPVEIPHAVSRRRARRSRHHRVGGEAAAEARHRSLVADRNRLVHRRQSGGPRPASGQARLADGGDAGLRHPRGGRRLQGGAARHDGLARRQAAAAAVVPADLVAARTTACAESYLAEFPGYYKTADAGYIDADGYVYVMGRTDDIINVAGHRLSTGGIEEVLSAHQDVAECAVLGIKDELKGEVPCGFIVLKAGVNRPVEDIEQECVQLVRDKIGPVASFRLAIIVERLPKTRSGKILRGTIKKIADGDTWTMPATIEDPKVLDEIGGALKGKGVGEKKKKKKKKKKNWLGLSRPKKKA